MPHPVLHPDRKRFARAKTLMAGGAPQLAQPPVGAPSRAYPDTATLPAPADVTAHIRLDGTAPLASFWLWRSTPRTGTAPRSTA
jgi:hypothetical protein